MISVIDRNICSHALLRQQTGTVLLDMLDRWRVFWEVLWDIGTIAFDLYNFKYQSLVEKYLVSSKLINELMCIYLSIMAP